MTKDKTLKIANDIAIGVDVTKDGTHVIATRLRPDGVKVVMYSQFHPLAQPEQEPVAWLTEKRYAELHTAQRTWVGLTDEEINEIYEAHHNQYGECESVNFGYERAIEAKLREKNT